MQDVGLRLLLIDDLHNIRGSGVGSMLVELRQVGSVMGVSLGAFATKEIAYALRQDEQLANRFELLTLPRWRLPLRQASHLIDPSLAEHILRAADGLISGVAHLLRRAAVEAVLSGRERINRAMLDRIGPASPKRIEAVALAADL